MAAPGGGPTADPWTGCGPPSSAFLYRERAVVDGGPSPDMTWEEGPCVSTRPGHQFAPADRHIRGVMAERQETTPAHHFLSMFQYTGTPDSSTPVRFLRNAIGWKNWPNGT